MTHFIIPLAIGGILAFGLYKRLDVFSLFLEGAREGMKTAVSILPALIGLMTCVGMFKASGGLDVLTAALTPAARFLHLPPEVIPLTLLRPISGSGALTFFEELLRSFGADSRIGQIASVLMGSTETTFYTLAVYFGAVQIRNTRHTLLCSLAADCTGFILSALFVHLLFV